MYSANPQQVRVPEIVDTFRRTSTPVSNAALLGARVRWRKSFTESHFLYSQNVFDALAARVEDLRATPENWNSYGSPPPADVSIENAHPVLRTLRAKLLEPERVIPSADGGVAFTFVSDTISRAAIETLNSGESYVLLYDLNGDSRTIEWPLEPDSQLQLVDQIVAHLRSQGIATQGE
jgi:hypothetical protein